MHQSTAQTHTHTPKKEIGPKSTKLLVLNPLGFQKTGRRIGIMPLGRWERGRFRKRSAPEVRSSPVDGNLRERRLHFFLFFFLRSVLAAIRAATVKLVALHGGPFWRQRQTHRAVALMEMTAASTFAYRFTSANRNLKRILVRHQPEAVVCLCECVREWVPHPVRIYGNR